MTLPTQITLGAPCLLLAVVVLFDGKPAADLQNLDAITVVIPEIVSVLNCVLYPLVAFRGVIMDPEHQLIALFVRHTHTASRTVLGIFGHRLFYLPLLLRVFGFWVVIPILGTTPLETLSGW